jgi:hypothetical protein
VCVPALLGARTRSHCYAAPATRSPSCSRRRRPAGRHRVGCMTYCTLMLTRFRARDLTEGERWRRAGGGRRAQLEVVFFHLRTFSFSKALKMKPQAGEVAITARAHARKKEPKEVKGATQPRPEHGAAGAEHRLCSAWPHTQTRATTAMVRPCSIPWCEREERGGAGLHGRQHEREGGAWAGTDESAGPGVWISGTWEGSD